VVLELEWWHGRRKGYDSNAFPGRSGENGIVEVRTGSRELRLVVRVAGEWKAERRRRERREKKEPPHVPTNRDEEARDERGRS